MGSRVSFLVEHAGNPWRDGRKRVGKEQKRENRVEERDPECEGERLWVLGGEGMGGWSSR